MKLTDNQLFVMSAVLGGSNLGMPMPKKKDVQDLLGSPHCSLDGCIIGLWQSYMDSDETADAFFKECRWWFNHKTNLHKGKSKSADPVYVARVWPDVAEVMGFAPTLKAVKGKKRS